MNVDGVDPQILLMYRISDVIGVFLMGIIGGTMARQRGYDIVGFLFIALFSALGGGMIRDVLINEGTVAAMATPEYLILAFTGALIARFVYFKGIVWERAQAHGDAIVSGLWAATGCVKALTFELPFLSCVMMGVFTAVGGSMIRDVVMGKVPAVFGNNQPTVIPAIACTLIVLVGNHLDHLAIGMVAGPIVSIALTVYGYWAGWRISTDQEWAPVNTAVIKMERGSRRIARELEPRRIRSWRHRQMEKALKRREQRAGSMDRDKHLSVEEMREHLAAELENASGESSGFGVDFGGHSYDRYNEETQTETTEFEALGGSGPRGAALDREEAINRVLADDDLMDELLRRLEQRYEQGQG